MKRYRRWMLWFCVAAVAAIAGLMIAQARRSARELELAGRLQTCNNIQQARTEGLVTVEDLPMLVDWVTRREKPAWMQRVQRKIGQWGGNLQPAESSFRGWALKGFEILGTNAAPAIPDLVEASQGWRGEEEVVFALGLIGEPMWETAYELARGESEGRALGAFLLGAAGMKADESREVLMKLTADPRIAVQEWAYVALAEFPTEQTETIFGEMLRSGDERKIKMGAYGLHLGGERAVKILVDAFDGTTNNLVRREVLAAFSTRDDVRNRRRVAAARFWSYQQKIEFFQNPTSEIRSFAERDQEVGRLWRAVRERVLAGKDAEVWREISRLRKAARERQDKSIEEERDVPN